MRQDYYSRDVDFDVLAHHDPAWARIVARAKQEKTLNFHDPAIVLSASPPPPAVPHPTNRPPPPRSQLTQTMLRVDFGLHLALPPDRLCPPVPVRWNYIRWIQELLDSTARTPRGDAAGADVRGLDIGVGASAVYPLLGCASRASWRMCGTDVDAESVASARENVRRNGLEGRVRVVGPRGVTEALVPLEEVGAGEGRWDFVMTNPPFFASREEMGGRGREGGPAAVCCGAEVEMVCPGGEVGFVSRMLEESRGLGGRVRWYTSMFGKLSSMRAVVAKLREHGITNYAVASLQAGHKTNRWAVAWSFLDWRPRNDVARRGELVADVLPESTTKTISLLMGRAEMVRRVDAVMHGLDVHWQWDDDGEEMGLMQARGNVWSRAARRRKQEGGRGTEMGEESDQGDASKFIVAISCASGKGVQVDWVRGTDWGLFESFCGMLRAHLHKSPESAAS